MSIDLSALFLSGRERSSNTEQTLMKYTQLKFGSYFNIQVPLYNRYYTIDNDMI